MNGVLANIPGKVVLVSGDGFEFVIDEEAARVSTTIRNMIDSQGISLKSIPSPPAPLPLLSSHPTSLLLSLSTPGAFSETTSRRVDLQTISGSVLEIVCQYFYYKLKYANTASKNIPDFKVPPEMSLNLLMASNFLDT